jgi:hypothetical protein
VAGKKGMGRGNMNAVKHPHRVYLKRRAGRRILHETRVNGLSNPCRIYGLSVRTSGHGCICLVRQSHSR